MLRRIIYILAVATFFAVGIQPAAQGRTVLRPSDLEYVGVLKVPLEVSAFSYGGFTFRKVGGQLRFILTGHIYGDEILEISAPGFDKTLELAPRAAMVRNWGRLHRMIGENPGGVFHLESLQWWNGSLYWTYGDSYNVAQVHHPTVGVTQLESGAVSGPWRTDLHSQKTRGLATTIPQWFADQHLGGKRLAVGSGIRSGNVNSPWGPALVAIPAPTSATPTNVSLASTPLVLPDVDHRSSRDPNYTALGFPDVSPTGGVGVWTQADWMNSAVWIDTPDKHGVIFFGTLGVGKIWYGPNGGYDGRGPWDSCQPGGSTTGPHAESRVQRWWIFDPMSFVPAIQGQVAPWTIQPAQVIDPAALGVALSGLCAEPFKAHVVGAAFDPDTRMLYIMTPEADPVPDSYPLPAIHAFHVRATGGAQPPAAPQNLRIQP